MRQIYRFEVWRKINKIGSLNREYSCKPKKRGGEKASHTSQKRGRKKRRGKKLHTHPYDRCTKTSHASQKMKYFRFKKDAPDPHYYFYIEDEIF